MSKRRFTWWMLGLLLVLLAAGFAWIVLPPGRPQIHVTAKAFMCVKDGMTEAEVEAIFGGPAGDYSTGRVYFSEELFPMVLTRSHRVKTWKSDEACVYVEFHPEDYVIWKHLLFPSPPHTWLERFRWRLGL
jgi:hypothetical protein